MMKVYAHGGGTKRTAGELGGAGASVFKKAKSLTSAVKSIFSGRKK